MAYSNEQLSSQAQPSPVTLSASSIGALRAWLQATRNESLGGRAIRKDDVRRAMRLVCDDVRSRHLPVERVIVLLKEQWQSLAQIGDGGNTRARAALDEIIHTCIDEYYASISSGSSATSASPASSPTSMEREARL